MEDREHRVKNKRQGATTTDNRQRRLEACRHQFRYEICEGGG